MDPRPPKNQRRRNKTAKNQQEHQVQPWLVQKEQRQEQHNVHQDQPRMQNQAQHQYQEQPRIQNKQHEQPQEQQHAQQHQEQPRLVQKEQRQEQLNVQQDQPRMQNSAQNQNNDEPSRRSTRTGKTNTRYAFTALTDPSSPLNIADIAFTGITTIPTHTDTPALDSYISQFEEATEEEDQNGKFRDVQMAIDRPLGDV